MRLVRETTDGTSNYETGSRDYRRYVELGDWIERLQTVRRTMRLVRETTDGTSSYETGSRDNRRYVEL